MSDGSLIKSEAFLALGCCSLRDVQPPVCRGTDPECFGNNEREAWPSPIPYGNGSCVSTRRVTTTALVSATGNATNGLRPEPPRRCAGWHSPRCGCSSG